MNVLELGCGNGLGATYARASGAKQIAVQDFNDDVLNSITIPNLALNIPGGSSSSTKSTNKSTKQPDKIKTKNLLLSKQKEEETTSTCTLFVFSGAWGPQLLEAMKTTFIRGGDDEYMYVHSRSKSGSSNKKKTAGT